MTEPFELTPPTELPPTGLPEQYEITDRPARTSKRAPHVSPALLADLAETIRTEKAITFNVESFTEKEVARLTNRLNALGRNAARDFLVRTRFAEGRVYAWAVPKQATVKRPKPPKDKD
jgi:hypothetical protein